MPSNLSVMSVLIHRGGERRGLSLSLCLTSSKWQPLPHALGVGTESAIPSRVIRAVFHASGSLTREEPGGGVNKP